MHTNLQDSHGHSVLVRVTRGVTCPKQEYHRPQFDQTEMRAPSCRRQTVAPNRSSTSAGGAPSIRERLVHVCRKPCQRKFMISASITASSNQCVPFSTGSSFLADRNACPLLWPRSCSTRGRPPQLHLTGRVLSSFFARGMFSILPF